MRRTFHHRYTCTSGLEHLELGCLRVVYTMANRWSVRWFFGRGLHGSCELEPEHGHRRGFIRTCILLGGLGGHLGRGVVGDESKLMLQINRGGKNYWRYSFYTRIT